MKSQPIPTDHYDLCVVGAGIAGLNALFSATQYCHRRHSWNAAWISTAGCRCRDE